MFFIRAAGERSKAIFSIVSYKFMEKNSFKLFTYVVTLCICKLLYKDDVHVCVNVTNVDGIPL